MAKKVISEKTKAYRKDYMVRYREENKQKLNEYASEYRKKQHGLNLGKNRKSTLKRIIEERQEFLKRKK